MARKTAISKYLAEIGKKGGKASAKARMEKSWNRPVIMTSMQANVIESIVRLRSARVLTMLSGLRKTTRRRGRVMHILMPPAKTDTAANASEHAAMDSGSIL